MVLLTLIIEGSLISAEALFSLRVVLVYRDSLILTQDSLQDKNAVEDFDSGFFLLTLKEPPPTDVPNTRTSNW